DHDQGGPDAASKPAKPAHAATAEKQVSERLLAKMFGDPEQLRAKETPENAGHRRVARRRRQATACQFPPEYPEADQGANRDQHAEARDVEIADAEERRIH